MRPIAVYPNPCLRGAQCEVPTITADMFNIARDLVETLIAAQGLGLAAPQLALPYQIIALHPSISPKRGKREDALVLFNPRIVELSPRRNHAVEGCLSFPGIVVGVSRSTDIRVAGVNQNGDPVEIDASGTLAQVLQHEIEHCGTHRLSCEQPATSVLLVDHAKRVKREMIHRRLTKKHAGQMLDYSTTPQGRTVMAQSAGELI